MQFLGYACKFITFLTIASNLALSKSVKNKGKDLSNTTCYFKPSHSYRNDDLHVSETVTKSFIVTTADGIYYESISNPVFELLNVTATQFIRRSVLSTLLFPELKTFSVGFNKPAFYESNIDRVQHLRAILKLLKTHTRAFPQDGAMLLWASRLSLKIADASGSVAYGRRLLALFDTHLLSRACRLPEIERDWPAQAIGGGSGLVVRTLI